MEEIMACRACLTTEAKLYHMYSCELVNAYENLTGFQMSQSDGLPHHLCSFCAAILLKSAAFQQRCRNAQDLLNYTLGQHVITTDYLRTIDRQTYNLTHSFGTAHNFVTIKEENNDHLATLDNDLTTILSSIIDQEVKIEENSDEEPLAKIVKKNRKKRKLIEDKKHILNNSNNLPIKEESIENTGFLKTGDEVEIDLPLVFDGEMFYDDNDEKPEMLDCGNGDEFPYHEIDIVELSTEEQIKEPFRPPTTPVMASPASSTGSGRRKRKAAQVETTACPPKARRNLALNDNAISQVLIEARKASPNYMNSAFKCHHCYKGFMAETTYRSHMDRHDPSFGAHACSVCALRFPCARTLRQHAASTHAHTYTCRRCGLVSKAKSRAKEHYKWHLGVTYTCDLCGVAFDKSTTLLSHLRLNHPTQHVCDICEVCFVSAHGLNMHTKKTHRVTTKNIRKEVVCDHCQMKFASKEALNKHLSLTNSHICDQNVRPCYSCGESFFNDVELRKHSRTHQAPDKTENSKCLECNKTFNSARYRAAHYQRVHAGHRRPAASVLCVCEVCGKNCKSRITLMYHQRTHSGEKPYQCTACPKTFSVSQRLQIHMRTHTGERPCQCPHCPKAFKHKAALNRHVRVHTGVKPYSCPHCSKSFSQSNSVKSHVRAVHLRLPPLYRRQRHHDAYSQ